MVIHDIMYGSQAAYIAESFPAHIRYSGASLGYQGAIDYRGGTGTADLPLAVPDVPIRGLCSCRLHGRDVADQRVCRFLPWQETKT